jgi:glutathione S-transferase
LEQAVPEDGFLVGASLTLADIAVVSPLANLAYMASEIDAAAYPKIAAYCARMFERASFSSYLTREAGFLRKVGVLGA